ncbi:GTPase ObgE [Ureaplasma miroungigenitalium]|uniref:GTPase Obg n=1 Tax=Ureaplasma miroungigenitalium TaxID=1042321 RepID=A0ABT3BM11_9BACT|nr:GTPase ObgE [Ureaplasma miroungigenitalium]MCV3728293.1 GTPase ObgE [Ureaplasma miroungigenitalium]MCV3734098.1 GTPase ObgE [Ureaplasma miroungigenitalium]
MAFVDKCDIILKAGNGGNGKLAWRRETHVPMGGPAGGNGGHGGSIYFLGSHNELSLEKIKYKKKFKAENGENGDIKNQHGANAEDVYIKVPLGTIVYNEDKTQVLAEVLIDQQAYLIQPGGLGGHGNTHFKNAFHKAPSLYEFGEVVEELRVHLELKSIADIGIIGLPNAGKSTLISSFTNAKPKTAAYQFTTLNPILGTIYDRSNRIVFADIPGLIEGAHQGSGLGIDFLKHIERCFLLLHLISLDENDHEDIVGAYETIRYELQAYDSALANKPFVIVANKMDTPNAQVQLQKLQNHLKNQTIITVSALDKINIQEMLATIIRMYYDEKQAFAEQQIHAEEIMVYQKPQKELQKTLDETIVIVKEEDHVFNVTGEYLKFWVNRIPLVTNDNIVRFNNKLDAVKFKEQLRAYGVETNDLIKVYHLTLEMD